MRLKVLRIAVLVGLIAVLAFFEVRWLGQVDYENQRERTESLLTEIAGEMNIIEAGLLDGGEVEEARGKFGAALDELGTIDFAVRERGEVVTRLGEYEAGLAGQVALAKELRMLKLMCDGFVGKIRGEMESQKVDAGLFRKINTDFLEFGDSLPAVRYVSSQGLVDNIKGLIEQVGVGAAAVANCVGVCPESAVRDQVGALQKKIDEVFVAEGEINRTIRAGFDSVIIIE